MTDTAELKPVAWRVKDYADGWIFYTDEKRARIEAEIMSGALVEPLYSADALSSLVRERDEARRVLRDHHKWHAESGILGIPDGDGGWIEMDNGAEYADSRLCQRTEETLRDMPPEFVVPPRGGWAMGSNHWENWQLAYRQKRAAEARATAAEAERDEAREDCDTYKASMKSYFEQTIRLGLAKDAAEAERDEARMEASANEGFAHELDDKLSASQADAARMREALKPFAREADARAKLALGPDIDDWPIGGSALTLGDLRRARNALGGKDE